MKLIILISALLFGNGFSTSDHQKVISGMVTDGKHPLIGVSVHVKGASGGTVTDNKGKYSINVPNERAILVFSFTGFETREVPVKGREEIDVALVPEKVKFQGDMVLAESAIQNKSVAIGGDIRSIPRLPAPAYPHNTEDYSPINENSYREVAVNPLSTFSIDVDAASYSNVRRFLENGQLPPADAVRVEELINYFNYEYPQPAGDDPVRIITEMAEAPWNPQHRLVRIGLQGKTMPAEDLPPSNLVFLIDVSGSMQAHNKLPLLKQAFKLLTDQFRPDDRVAIVTYASTSGIALNATPGSEKQVIKRAIEQLSAGGSTAGGAGIEDAYRIAREHFIKGGNNRVILATDGDFNVGVSSDGALQQLITSQRESGVYLSVLGFGMGNYKDNKLELLADKGNGNYAYIDTFNEARKVLVSEFGGTLYTIAQDVKLQVEFNPRYVASYRLVGYENRMLNEEDFEDDKKDAGEMGAGHTVTALYELVPAGAGEHTDKLKYQELRPSAAADGEEVLTVKLRYKQPGEKNSKEISSVLTSKATPLEATSENFRFAASVAGFGMLLRDSEFKGTANYQEIIRLASQARGDDPEGYRAEFISLLKTAELLAESQPEKEDLKDDLGRREYAPGVIR